MRNCALCKLDEKIPSGNLVLLKSLNLLKVTQWRMTWHITVALHISGCGIAVKANEVAALVKGKPYIWGGKTLDGFDCSGFVSYVLKLLFPHNSTQFELNVAGYIKSDLLSDIDEADLRPGDLIIFPASGGHPNHVGIVYDSNSWIGSQSRGVSRVKFSDPWWSRRKKKFRRLKMVSTASIQTGCGVMVA